MDYFLLQGTFMAYTFISGTVVSLMKQVVSFQLALTMERWCLQIFKLALVNYPLHPYFVCLDKEIEYLDHSHRSNYMFSL